MADDKVLDELAGAMRATGIHIYQKSPANEDAESFPSMDHVLVGINPPCTRTTSDIYAVIVPPEQKSAALIVQFFPSGSHTRAGILKEFTAGAEYTEMYLEHNGRKIGIEVHRFHSSLPEDYEIEFERVDTKKLRMLCAPPPRSS